MEILDCAACTVKSWGDNAFVYDCDEVFCAWQNRWVENALTTQVTLDFFLPLEDGCYERVGEEFEERVYPQEVLETPGAPARMAMAFVENVIFSLEFRQKI